MELPTAELVRAWSPPTLDWAALGYPEGGAPDPLEQLVAEAVGDFRRITGLSFAAVPADDEALAQKAIRGLTALGAAQATEDYAETLADFDLIQSFSAGEYTETRRSAEDARKARALVAWPWLSDLLWGLLTDDQHDYYVEYFGGQNRPAFEITEVDWGDRMVRDGLDGGFGYGRDTWDEY